MIFTEKYVAVNLFYVVESLKWDNMETENMNLTFDVKVLN